jgi:hypothetical protein
MRADGPDSSQNMHLAKRKDLSCGCIKLFLLQLRTLACGHAPSGGIDPSQVSLGKMQAATVISDALRMRVQPAVELSLMALASELLHPASLVE